MLRHRVPPADSPTRTPDISVVVPSHDRPLRLRWLLNALEEQTLDRSRWEVIIGHDSSGPETEQLLRDHPLARAGVLRWVASAPGSAPPGANRNRAWEIARGPLIAFTDDDCRPPADWLANALAAAQANPDAIVQGSTRSDPDEAVIRLGYFVHSQSIWPPRPWAQCCNIVYPRSVLEAMRGFDETMYVGEDTDLAFRARKSGTPYVGEPKVMTYHCVEEVGPVRHLRGLQRWSGLPELIRRHPELRDEFPTGYFWKRTHVWFLPALFGVWRMRRRRGWVLLTLPYLIQAIPGPGDTPKARALAWAVLPHAVASDASEMIALARGSIRHRRFFL
jgi:glycosyltransferase involved in cell wall biosynthesis